MATSAKRWRAAGRGLRRRALLVGLALASAAVARPSAAQVFPLTPSGQISDAEPLFSWTTPNADIASRFELSIAAVGSLLDLGTIAPLELEVDCVPGAPSHDGCFCWDGGRSDGLGVCGVELRGASSADPFPPDVPFLLTGDGDEYAFRVRDAAPAPRPEYSAPLNFRDGPSFAPSPVFPGKPGGRPLVSTGAPVPDVTGDGGLDFDWAQSLFAAGYEVHLFEIDPATVDPERGGRPRVVRQLCAGKLDSVEPPARCDELIDGRTYMWEVRGFNAWPGSCTIRVVANGVDWDPERPYREGRCLGGVVSNAPMLFRYRTAGPACVGDCNEDGAVAVNELVTAVNISLGQLPVDVCPSADADGDDRTTINELVRAVGSSLNGCPAAAPSGAIGAPRITFASANAAIGGQVSVPARLDGGLGAVSALQLDLDWSADVLAAPSCTIDARLAATHALRQSTSPGRLRLLLSDQRCLDQPCAGGPRTFLDGQIATCRFAVSSAVARPARLRATGAVASNGSGKRLDAAAAASPVGICPAVPDASACARPLVGDRSSLRIRARSDAPARNELLWKWTRGPALVKEDFGDPTGATDLMLCVYDDLQLVQAVSLPAGGSCDGRSCWRESASGFRYQDHDGSNGGLSDLRIGPAEEGRSKILLKARGASLAVSAGRFPYGANVVVELHSSDAHAGEKRCWSAWYPQATVSDAATGSYRAIGD